MMKHHKIVLFAISIIFLLYGCKTKVDSPKELTAFIKDPHNHVYKEIVNQEIKTSLMFMPVDLLNAKLSKATKSQTEISQNNNLYFLISFSANNKEILRQVELAKYSELVQLFSFEMADYVYAIANGGKIINAKEVLFQNSFGSARSNQLLVIFPKQDLLNTSNFLVRIKDFGLNTGNIDFQMNTKDILATPTLNTNNQK